MPVAKTIVAVMRELDAIGKNRKNQAQGFNFRGIDDLYNALHDVMAKHGLFTIPRVVAERTEERQTKNGSNLIYRVLSIEFDFMDESGEKITVGPMIGEGMDNGDKASNKAHAIAHKYALLQVFCIPTEDAKDPDAESPKAEPRHDLARPSDVEMAKATARKSGMSEGEIAQCLGPNPTVESLKLLCDRVRSRQGNGGKASAPQAYTN